MWYSLGSHKCACKPGFEPMINNVYKCKNINECELTGTDYPCHENAKCLDTQGYVILIKATRVCVSRIDFF